MSFRENLQYLRASKNLTQEQLAMLLGVSRQSVTKWEAERSYPEMDKLLKLCQLFDCSLDDLVQGNVAAAQALKLSAVRNAEQQRDNAQTEESRGIPAQPEDVTGYDSHWREFARKITLGVGLCGFSLVPAALLANDQVNSDALSLGVPVGNLAAFLFLAFVALGVAVIVPAGLAHKRFRAEHPFVINFYTADDCRRATVALGRSIAGGVACVLAATGYCILAEGSSSTSVHAAIWLLAATACAALIVHAALMATRVNVETFNDKGAARLTPQEIDELPCDEPERDRIRRASVRSKKTGAICAAIMIGATAIGLVWMFAVAGTGLSWGYNLASMFWLAWVVGALACGVVRAVRGVHL